MRHTLDVNKYLMNLPNKYKYCEKYCHRNNEKTVPQLKHVCLCNFANKSEIYYNYAFTIGLLKFVDTFYFYL